MFSQINAGQTSEGGEHPVRGSEGKSFQENQNTDTDSLKNMDLQHCTGKMGVEWLNKTAH